MIDAAVELFSLQSWEMVTAAEIAEPAGNDLGSVLLLFSSREQLPEEVVQRFSVRVETIRALLAEAEDEQDSCRIPVALLDQLDGHQRAARLCSLGALQRLRCSASASTGTRAVASSARRGTRCAGSARSATRPRRI